MAAPGEGGSRSDEPDATATIAASYLPLLPPSAPLPPQRHSETSIIRYKWTTVLSGGLPNRPTPTNRHGNA